MNSAGPITHNIAAVCLTKSFIFEIYHFWGWSCLLLCSRHGSLAWESETISDDRINPAQQLKYFTSKSGVFPHSRVSKLTYRLKPKESITAATLLIASVSLPHNSTRREQPHSNVRPAFFYTKAFVYNSVAICLIMTKRGPNFYIILLTVL